MGEVPWAATATGRVARQFWTYAPCQESCPTTTGCFPLSPECHTKARTDPASQGPKNARSSSETAIHTLRLMGSGLFDDYPKLKIILGHLGEGLPCNIWRIDNRISRTLGAKPKAKLPMGHYLRENFYITTSGNFCTQTLTEVMMEVGADRIPLRRLPI